MSASSTFGQVPDKQEVRAALERMLAKDVFARSARLSQFLRFVVEHSLDDDVDSLKEYSLGLEVFGRDETYDPRIDPIVRVEARRLRAKLKQYYEQDGSDDEIRIELPKGAYVPVFSRWSGPAVFDAALGEQAAGPADTAAALAELDDHALAVLPFLALSNDDETTSFADGLTEELIYALSGVPDLKVTSRTSVFTFKGSPLDVREIGVRLRVRLAVEGSVRRAGRRLRVTARLVDVADDAQLWTNQFDRNLENVFEIQDDIAGSIVRVLRGRLRSGQTRSIVRQRTASLKAYSLYLKGKEFWARRNQRGLEEGVAYFERAVSDDPSYASAYAGLVDCYALYETYLGRAPETFLPQAREAARKALEIGPDLAEAHTAAGVLDLLAEWNWQRGEEHFLKALDLNPGYPAARHWYGRFLASRVRADQALDELRAARDLDPLSPPAYFAVGFARYYAGRFVEAERTFERTLLLESGFELAHDYLGRTYLALDQPEKAVAAFDLAARIGPGGSLLGSLRATALAAAGREDEARAALGRLEEASVQGRPTHHAVAAARLALGDRAGAAKALGEMVEARSQEAAYLIVDPLFQSLHGDPGYGRAIASVSSD